MIITDLLRWWMLQILWNVGTRLPEYMVTSQETVLFCVSAMISAILHYSCVLCCRGIICVKFMRHVACSSEYPISISLHTWGQSSEEALRIPCTLMITSEELELYNRFSPFPHMCIIDEVHIKFPALVWVTYLEHKFAISKQFLSSVYPPFYSTSLLMIKAVLCSFWTANKTWVQEVKNYCRIGYL